MVPPSSRKSVPTEYRTKLSSSVRR
jgi:hypothetical protein